MVGEYAARRAVREASWKKLQLEVLRPSQE